MHTVQHHDVDDFVAAVRPGLQADETRHNLILGIVGALATYPERTLLTVEDEEGTVAVMVRTPPYPWSLAVTAEVDLDRLVPVVVAALAANGWDLPAVTSERHVAERVARAWADVRGGRAVEGMALRTMEATAVRAPGGVPGSRRPATAGDVDLVAAWTRAFTVEALPGEDVDAAVTRAVDAVRRGDHGLHLWVDHEPVSMAAIGRPTVTAERLGPVYTPPERRGMGYGGALTAALTQDAFDRGCERVLLYTDATNPTSNALYARLGYREVGQAARWDVADRDA